MASFPRPVGSSVQPVYNYIRGLIMTYELQQAFLFVCLVPPICGCTEAMPRCCIKLHRANLPIVPSLSFPLYAAIPAIRRPFFSPPPFPFFSFLSSPLLSFLFLSFCPDKRQEGRRKRNFLASWTFADRRFWTVKRFRFRWWTKGNSIAAESSWLTNARERFHDLSKFRIIFHIPSVKLLVIRAL